MTLTVTVLGGAAAWPNPGQGCSAYLVTSGETRVLLDCGPNTLLELRKHADYTTVSAVIVSHCHADHILDLIPYRYGLVYGPSELQRRIPVWLPDGGIERMMRFAEACGGQGEEASDFWSTVFDFREYRGPDIIEIDELRVSFASTQHFVPCFAMRVEGPSGVVVGYTADTGTIEPLDEALRGAGTVIVEATLRDHDDTPPTKRGHLTPEDAGVLADRVGATTLILTHLWSERPDDDVVSAARTRFSGEILVAKPGLVVRGYA